MQVRLQTWKPFTKIQNKSIQFSLLHFKEFQRFLGGFIGRSLRIFLQTDKSTVKKAFKRNRVYRYIIWYHDYIKKIDNVIHYISEYFNRSKYQEN